MVLFAHNNNQGVFLSSRKKSIIMVIRSEVNVERISSRTYFRFFLFGEV